MNEVIQMADVGFQGEATLEKRESSPVETTVPGPITHSRMSEQLTQSRRNQKQQGSNNLPPSPVLLVCIYNKTGKIITHDYFYENFSPYGQIVKILIFEKAKVWKTFVEFRSVEQAEYAKEKLNNKVVFQDGSKMNIFPAKLRSIELQNSNLGGVNYEHLKNQSQQNHDQLYYSHGHQWGPSGYPQYNMGYGQQMGYYGQNSPNNHYSYYPHDASPNHGYNYQAHYNTYEEEDNPPMCRGRRSTLGGSPNELNTYKNGVHEHVYAGYSGENANSYYAVSPMGYNTHHQVEDQRSRKLSVDGSRNSSGQKQTGHEVKINVCNDKIRQNYVLGYSTPHGCKGSKSENSSDVWSESGKDQFETDKLQTGSQFLHPHKTGEKSQRKSSFKSFEDVEQKSTKKGFAEKSFHSLFCNADEQFRELAEESAEYRAWKQEAEKIKGSTLNATPKKVNEALNTADTPDKMSLQQQLEGGIRRKSLTVNYLPQSHTEQFIQENIPSKVLFIRSIPTNYNPEILYNIFVNFGEIIRVIYMRNKMSALIEYAEIEDAIQAKDELNYCKCEARVFYSHYQTLMNRYGSSQHEDCEEFQCRKADKAYSQHSGQAGKTEKKMMALNPPSETLYLTQLLPENQSELYRQIQDIIGCKITKVEWKKQKATQVSHGNQNGSYSYSNSNYNKGKSGRGSSKNSYGKSSNKESRQKWMCLIQLRNINESLLIMGSLQGLIFTSGKNRRELKISFTRSKISGPGDARGLKTNSSSYRYDATEPGERQGSPGRLMHEESKSRQSGSQFEPDSEYYDKPTELQEFSPDDKGHIRSRWNTVSFNSIPQFKDEDQAAFEVYKNEI